MHVRMQNIAVEACAKMNRPTPCRGRVSYPHEVEGWSEVSTLFSYIGLLVKTTSGDASKADPSSKSDWTLSRRRADSASRAKKEFFRHNF